ncbi:MAG TPA: N-acetylmuramoyl-L-alanine amidase [Pseudomonadales bacterium]|nr:N-acetylmuramoyl-L-alanine amidase [Pseudomonadales bacterium]
MRAILFLIRLTVMAAVLAVGLPVVKAVSFNGQYYVPLAEFARANGFSMASVRRGEEVVLVSKGGARLVFDVNSAQAQIAGVNVRLSFPVAADHGQLLVSQLDIDTALRPLIYAQKPSARRITTICIDPGHGGKDPGNRVGGGIWGHSEKTYTLALAMELQKQLQRAGFRVILTRSRDAYVDLPARPATANSAGADLFISLHFNATPVDKADISGPETYCITPVGAPSSNAHGESGEFSATAGLGPTTANRDENKSLLLAYVMEKSLVLNLHANDRGVRRARFAVLRDATMPAILIEGGYMTHPVEGKKIFDSTYRSELAAAIVKGVLAYQKAMAPPVLHPSTPPNRLPPSHVSPLH